MQCDAVEKIVMVESLISRREYNEDLKGELQAFQERTCWVENQAAETFFLSLDICCSVSQVLHTGQRRGEVVSPFSCPSTGLTTVSSLLVTAP